VRTLYVLCLFADRRRPTWRLNVLPAFAAHKVAVPTCSPKAAATIPASSWADRDARAHSELDPDADCSQSGVRILT